MHAHIGGPGAAGRDGVEQSQLPVGAVDREGADRAFLAFAHPVGFVGGIQAGPGGVQRQAARAGPQLVDAARRQGAGGAIHCKQVNAASVSGRQIHLRRQHVAERRAERAHVGHQGVSRLGRLRLEQTRQEWCAACRHGGGFQERTPGAFPRKRAGWMVHDLTDWRRNEF